MTTRLRTATRSPSSTPHSSAASGVMVSILPDDLVAGDRRVRAALGRVHPTLEVVEVAVAQAGGLDSQHRATRLRCRAPGGRARPRSRRRGRRSPDSREHRVQELVGAVDGTSQRGARAPRPRSRARRPRARTLRGTRRRARPRTNPSSARSPSPGTTRPPGEGRSNVPKTASEIWKTARRAPARRTASSGSRSIQQFPTSAMTPMPARSATSVPSRRVCTNDTSVRNEGSIASVTPRDSAYFAHGATASASDAASSSNDRPSRRPGVKYVHPPTSAARSIESLTAARVASQLAGVGKVEHRR